MAYTVVEIYSSQTWTVPSGVTSLDLVIVGAGGNGGSVTKTTGFEYSAGGGGGAGQYLRYTNYLVSPGQVLTITVGVAGGGAVSGQGGTTTVTGGSGGTFSAVGGLKGTNGTNSTPGTGGNSGNGFAGAAPDSIDTGGGGGGATEAGDANGGGGAGISLTVGGTAFILASGGSGLGIFSGNTKKGGGGNGASRIAVGTTSGQVGVSGAVIFAYGVAATTLPIYPNAISLSQIYYEFNPSRNPATGDRYSSDYKWTQIWSGGFDYYDIYVTWNGVEVITADSSESSPIVDTDGYTYYRGTLYIDHTSPTLTSTDVYGVYRVPTAGDGIALPMKLSNYYTPSSFTNTISGYTTHLNLRTWALANGWDGVAPATITVATGAYIYSTSTGTPALTIDGSWPGGLTFVNNGVIMGMGGNGAPATGGASAGGTAIYLGRNTTITNNGYILGGGGAGQAGTTYVTSNWGYANVGGGGGAGGGAGGSGFFSGGTYGLVNTSSGGSGGTPPAAREPSTGGNYTAGTTYWADDRDSGAWLGTVIYWNGTEKQDINNTQYAFKNPIIASDGYAYWRGDEAVPNNGLTTYYYVYRTTSAWGSNATQAQGYGGGAGGGGGGYYVGSGGSLYAGGGGGGGRSVDDMSGGAQGTSGSYAGGSNVISGGGGSNGSVGQNYQASLGAGGGGGYGAAGGTGNGTGPYGGGGAGGKAVALNGYTLSLTNNGTRYGAIS